VPREHDLLLGQRRYRVEPVVANGRPNTANGAKTDNAQCGNAEVGAGNLLTQLGIPLDTLGVRTAGAITSITPEIGKAIDQKIGSLASVEGLTLGNLAVLGVATSAATGTCTPGSLTPNLQGTSNVATLAGGDLDGLVGAIANLLSISPQLINVKINEQVRTPTSLTVRAAHITVLSSTAGGPPVLDLVVAESKVGFDGPVCDPDKQGGPRRLCPAPRDRATSRAATCASSSRARTRPAVRSEPACRSSARSSSVRRSRVRVEASSCRSTARAGCSATRSACKATTIRSSR